jgi:hypothetical protein
MLRRRYVVGATLVVAVVLSLGVLQGVASASTTINTTMTERGSYSCLGPCATATYFTITGKLHADSKVLGTMAESGTGTVLDYNPVTNCLDNLENYAFTTQNGKDTIYLATTSDTYCFTPDPNVNIETATYTITGGTGRFAGATGSATSVITVLTHPQTGSGSFALNITY